MRRSLFEEDDYFVVDGRKMTRSGFCQAVDFNNKPMVFMTAFGKTEPVMMGVSEFGVPGVREFIRNENHLKSSKVPAHTVIWLPAARGHRHGVVIDGEMYREVQMDPKKFPDRVARLAELGIGLDINLS